MKWFSLILEVLSGIDFKRWLTNMVVVIFGTVLILAFLALIISLMQWGGEYERKTIFYLADYLFLVGDVYVTVTFLSLALLQISSFILLFTPLWEKNWFRIAVAFVLISYPTVLWILMRIHERMRP